MKIHRLSAGVKNEQTEGLFFILAEPDDFEMKNSQLKTDT